MSCKICEHPDRIVIEGWILAGEGILTIKEWCERLEPPLHVARRTVDEHLDAGHVDVGRVQIVSMLVKFNRQANGIIEDTLANPNSMPKGSLQQAMIQRGRCIELIAKANNVIEVGTRITNQKVAISLSPEMQLQLAKQAVKELEAPSGRQSPPEPAVEQPEPVRDSSSSDSGV